MSYTDKQVENLQRINDRLRKENLAHEIASNKDREYIKYLEERVKGLELQIALNNKLQEPLERQILSTNQ